MASSLDGSTQRRREFEPSFKRRKDERRTATDLGTLQAMLLSHAAELAEVRSARLAQDGALAAARARIIEPRSEMEALNARLAKLLRATSADRRRSCATTSSNSSCSSATSTRHWPKRPRLDRLPGADSVPIFRGRRPLPEALPRDIVSYRDQRLHEAGLFRCCNRY